MRGIQVGEKETHRDGFETLFAHAFRDQPHGVLVERFELRAGRVEPSGDLRDRFRADERRGLAVMQIEQPVPVAARDPVNVADSLRGQDQHVRAAPFEQRVEALRGAVHEELDLRERQVESFQRTENAAREVVGGGEHLARAQPLRRAVVDDHVGEGAADVHGDPVGHGNSLSDKGNQVSARPSVSGSGRTASRATTRKATIDATVSDDATPWSIIAPMTGTETVFASRIAEVDQE